jgi:hypothetical protein
MHRDTVVVPAATPMQQAARWTKTKIAPAEAPRAQVGGGDLPQHSTLSGPNLDKAPITWPERSPPVRPESVNLVGATAQRMEWLDDSDEMKLSILSRFFPDEIRRDGTMPGPQPCSMSAAPRRNTGTWQHWSGDNIEPFGARRAAFHDITQSTEACTPES